MCSVRHRPTPSAPNRRARAASSGVSAFARTPRRRSSSHQPSSFAKRSSTSGRTSGTSSVVTAPVEPSMAIMSPARSTRSPTWTSWACRSMSRSPAPVTAGRPIPRATSAACEALPPSLVRMPAAALNPATSSASVNGRTSTTASPFARRGDRVLGREDDARPSPRPGTRRPRGRSRRTRASGSNVGCSSASSLSASIVAIACARVSSPSSTASTAKRTAACAGRLARASAACTGAPPRS